MTTTQAIIDLFRNAADIEETERRLFNEIEEFSDLYIVPDVIDVYRNIPLKELRLEGLQLCFSESLYRFLGHFYLEIKQSLVTFT